jgi:hypothetical protein
MSTSLERENRILSDVPIRLLINGDAGAEDGMAALDAFDLVTGRAEDFALQPVHETKFSEGDCSGFNVGCAVEASSGRLPMPGGGPRSLRKTLTMAFSLGYGAGLPFMVETRCCTRAQRTPGLRAKGGTGFRDPVPLLGASRQRDRFLFTRRRATHTMLAANASSTATDPSTGPVGNVPGAEDPALRAGQRSVAALFPVKKKRRHHRILR